jgi:hypothetical protein
MFQTERRRQRLFTEILQPADGTNDRYTLGRFGFARVYGGAPNAMHDGGDARHVQNSSNDAKGACRKSRHCHRRRDKLNR